MSSILIEGRFVVCAACRYGDLIICGARHFDNVMHSQLKHICEDKLFSFEEAGHVEQGFIDQYGVFMGRSEAYDVAEKAGQLNVRRLKSGNPNERELFSEDLY